MKDDEQLKVRVHIPDGALEDLEYLASKYGIGGVLDGLLKVCDKQLGTFPSDGASLTTEQRTSMREWRFARDGVRGLSACLQYILENGPGSNNNF